VVLQPSKGPETGDGNEDGDGNGIEAQDGPGDEASGTVTVQADIVIGADGAGSKTRRLLQELVCCWAIHVLLLLGG
jgi:2-polyprenyl-6-methoxyphenol hydroxylase-like FAD-dependent oxidoreductase